MKKNMDKFLYSIDITKLENPIHFKTKSVKITGNIKDNKQK